ncbi:restriction endonuclease [Carboxylicivirga marina]|uniref:Restriction endonuclease n=1 Tax=Carboxylicivirga marina TaxID=2800988 RepID=A0ABS1HRX7_9BACT|nr:restriction endonuclease [Carboxylicivirga marina]MBK3520018.1 restriction endonuclease [Carboxylicivirga marina]
MSEKTNLDWKKYESITKYIYETLGKKSGVKIEGYGNNCKVKGKSGVNHQIDVLTNHSDGIHSYKTAIECKYWKDKINKDIVMKVSEIIEDAGLNKGIIVSRSGFTPDGISFAKHRNIGLVELREIEENDFQGRKRIFDIKTWINRPEILRTVIDAVDKTELAGEVIEIDKVKIELLDGKKTPFIDYMTTFKKELHNVGFWQVFSKGYRLDSAYLINEKSNSKIKIREIIFTGVLTRLNSNLKFYPVDQIWLIMKSLFEERTFTITEKGIIREDKN